MSEVTERPRKAVQVLDCPVDWLTMDDALGWCLDTCRGDGPARIVLTVNASHLVDMQGNADLREACLAADLVTADGMSIVWASRLLGQPLPERVAGVDLLTHLLRLGEQQGLRFFFLGAKPEVLTRFLSVCRRRHPKLEVAGWRDGYFTAEDHAAVVQDIAASRPDILFVAMPSPFKDIWCEQYRDKLGARLIIGVGGSFDVLAGVVPRAPSWMQRVGLEWGWRLLREPRRLWRRYLFGNSRFTSLIMRDWLRGRRPDYQS
jgi:N-acetylglucosaminyldiphosphoundecaprenol N-acetyl-beta-D-mannosaminyltransferase